MIGVKKFKKFENFFLKSKETFSKGTSIYSFQFLNVEKFIWFYILRVGYFSFRTFFFKYILENSRIEKKKFKLVTILDLQKLFYFSFSIQYLCLVFLTKYNF